MKHVFVLLAMMLGLAAGCRVSDVREMEVRVPAMASEADVQKVRSALSQLGGIDHEKLVFDIDGRTVKVRYDSMVVAHKNIEIAIAEAGYDANDIKAIAPAPAR
ncbi:MAG TPA: heavy-metal-associated domain-containing protein [Kiritimatiellia bacterium]|nr:heavy-metal-associated domain-containing protein [Kiritimatiellia bacterium]HRU69608.1 heavy-metal-associated domain-containing protein [Kiritimatiellia bacterium]